MGEEDSLSKDGKNSVESYRLTKLFSDDKQKKCRYFTLREHFLRIQESFQWDIKSCQASKNLKKASKPKAV